MKTKTSRDRELLSSVIDGAWTRAVWEVLDETVGTATNSWQSNDPSVMIVQVVILRSTLAGFGDTFRGGHQFRMPANLKADQILDVMREQVRMFLQRNPHILAGGVS